jgi:hypothetical protein
MKVRLLVRDMALLLLGAALSALAVVLLVPFLSSNLWNVYIPAVVALFCGMVLVEGWCTQARLQRSLVDVWGLQQKLMHASGQHLPASPELNQSSVLYLALTCEELSEAASTMHKILSSSSAETWGMDRVVRELASASRALLASSSSLRLACVQQRGFSKPLNHTEAILLLDDVADTTVTVAGLSLACGLPGGAGYAEIQRSNLSKANPDSGRIEKTADGKWIKGSEYRPPDLYPIVALHIDPPHPANS